MAKTIQYKIDFNTSKAEQELDGIDKQLDDIQEKSKVDLLIETSQSVKSVGDVRKAYKDLRDAQIEVGEGTEEFTRLGTAAAGLKDKLDAVNEVARDLGGSTFEKLSNSFGRIKEGIVNLDLDKVKQGFGQLVTTFRGLTEGLTKGQIAARAFGAALAATGIGLIVAAIGLLITNFDKLKNSGGALGAVLTSISNGINLAKGVIIAFADSIGLIDKNAIASNEKTIKSLEETAKKLSDLRKEVYNDSLNELDKAIAAEQEKRQKEFAVFINDLKAKRLSQEEEFVANEAFIAESERRIQVIRDKFAADEAAKAAKTAAEKAAAAKAEAAKKIQEAKDEEEKKAAAREAIISKFGALSNEANRRAMQTRINIIEAGFIKEGKETEDGLNEIQDERQRFQRLELKSLEVNGGLREAALREQLQKKLITEQEYIALSISAAVEQADAEALIRLNGFKLIKDISNRKLAITQAESSSEQTKLKKIEDIAKVIETFQGTEIEKAQMQINLFDQKIAQLESQNISEGELYEALVDKKLEAEFRLRDAVLATEEEKKAARMEAIQTGLSAASNFTNALTSLSDSIFANELANAKGNAVEEEKIRRKSFEANKALGITNAVISGAQAVISAFNAGASMGPAGVVMGPVMAALAASSAAVNIATIANAQYSPTGTAATPTTTTVPSPSVPSSVTPSVSFAGEGTTGFNQVGGGSNQFNMSASISVSEINNIQNQVAVYETGSLLNGG